MKISVITCTWNSEPYLAESIASVLCQDHDDLEYIFVDGGSTDGTLERISSIPRECKIVHGVRGGISNAMNVGVQHATGDLIAHLHSDDYYLHGGVLSTIASVMKNSSRNWCFGRTKRVIKGQLVPESYVAPKYSKYRLLNGNFIPHPATFVRADVFRSLGGFKNSLKYAMDYDLWLRLSELGDPIEVGQPLAAFREHEGSLSSANKLSAMEEDFRVRMEYCDEGVPARLLHRMRYLVRRRRVQRTLQATGQVNS